MLPTENPASTNDETTPPVTPRDHNIGNQEFTTPQEQIRPAVPQTPWAPKPVRNNLITDTLLQRRPRPWENQIDSDSDSEDVTRSLIRQQRIGLPSAISASDFRLLPDVSNQQNTLQAVPEPSAAAVQPVLSVPFVPSLVTPHSDILPALERNQFQLEHAQNESTITSGIQAIGFQLLSGPKPPNSSSAHSVFPNFPSTP